MQSRPLTIASKGSDWPSRHRTHTLRVVFLPLVSLSLLCNARMVGCNIGSPKLFLRPALIIFLGIVVAETGLDDFLLAFFRVVIRCYKIVIGRGSIDSREISHITSSTAL